LCSGSRCGNCQPAQQTTAQRGYGTSHQAERARWKPVVDAGQAYCAETVCLERDRYIPPGTPWDLAHAPGGGYLGPAHQSCNRSEGATRGNRGRRKRWTTSRRW
jgi:hypothetical protein